MSLSRADALREHGSISEIPADMTFAERYKSELLHAIDQIDLRKVHQAIEWFTDARARQQHIFVFGNGGSASTASHFTCDILKGASYNMASRFRIMALTDSLPTITAYSNDVAYDSVFVEQLKNFAHPRFGDGHQRLRQLAKCPTRDRVC